MARLTLLPAHLRNLVSQLAAIPAQKARDLLDREAAQEHIAQLTQFRIRPLFAGSDGRLFVLGLGLGRLRIEDQCANQAQKRISFRILRPAEERADLNIGHVTARGGIRLVPDEGHARRGVASEEPGIAVRAAVELSGFCARHALVNTREPRALRACMQWLRRSALPTPLEKLASLLPRRVVPRQASERINAQPL